MRSFYAIGLIAVAKIGTAAVALLAAVVASRLLSVAEFGTISLILSIATVSAAVIDWGTATYVRKHSTFFSRRSSPRVGPMLLRLLGPMLLRGAAASVPFLLALPIYGAEALVFVLVAPIALAFAMELLCGELLRGRRYYIAAEYYGGGLRQTVYLLTLLSIGILVPHLGWIASIYTIALLAAALLSVVAIGGIRRPGLRRGARAPAPRRQGHERLHFMLITILNVVLAQLPLLYAGVAGSTEVAGYVRVSLLFGILAQMALSANAMYFAPRISATARSESGQLQSLVRESSRLGLLALPLGAVGVVLVPFLIDTFFGTAYARSSLGAQVLVAIFAVLSLFGAFGQVVLLRGGERVALVSASLALVSQLILIPLLTLRWPVEGYAFAYGLSILASYAYLAIAGQRATGIRPGPL